MNKCRAERDLRVDLIRGLALFIIFIDHNGFRWLSDYTFHRYSLIDASDVFFFLSGYVSGLAYSAVLFVDGFRGCLAKALRRCGELYIAQLGLLLVSLLLIDLASLEQWTIPWMHYWRGFTGLDTVSHSSYVSLSTLINAITLKTAPPMLDFLPVYMMLIAATPVALYLRLHYPAVLVIGSVSVYILAHIPNTLQFELWTFNPFAWQLVFLGGMLIGHHKACHSSARWHPSSGLLFAAIAGLALITFLRIAPSKLVAGVLHTDALRNSIPLEIPLTGKHNADPMRSVNLLLWVVVVASISPTAKLLKASVARIPVVCGRCPLGVFCVGVILNYAGLICMGITRGGKVWELGWTLIGLTVLVITPAYWARARSSFYDYTSGHRSFLSSKWEGLAGTHRTRLRAPREFTTLERP